MVPRAMPFPITLHHKLSHNSIEVQPVNSNTNNTKKQSSVDRRKEYYYLRSRTWPQKTYSSARELFTRECTESGIETVASVGQHGVTNVVCKSTDYNPRRNLGRRTRSMINPREVRMLTEKSTLSGRPVDNSENQDNHIQLYPKNKETYKSNRSCQSVTSHSDKTVPISHIGCNIRNKIFQIETSRTSSRNLVPDRDSLWSGVESLKLLPVWMKKISNNIPLLIKDRPEKGSFDSGDNPKKTQSDPSSSPKSAILTHSDDLLHKTKPLGLNAPYLNVDDKHLKRRLGKLARIDGLFCLSLGQANSTYDSEEVLVMKSLYVSSFISGNCDVDGNIVHGDPAQSMVLEGWLPSGEDRFVVHIRAPPPQKYRMGNRSGEQRFDTKQYSRTSFVKTRSRDNWSLKEDTQNDIANIDLYLWGSEGPPSNSYSYFGRSLSRGRSRRWNGNNGTMLSCPVDTDSDLFIIDTMDHLKSVHFMGIQYLEKGDFDNALIIFQKIVRSHHSNVHNICSSSNDDSAEKRRKRSQYLVGSALHNLGVVNMWAGNFRDALACFRDAFYVRREVLPRGHFSVAVTLSCLGTVSFALGKFNVSYVMFTQAFKILNEDEVAISKLWRKKSKASTKSSELAANIECTDENMLGKAKLLNNIGCAQYKAGKLKDAHDSLSKSFHLQQEVWLKSYPSHTESCVNNQKRTAIIHLQKKSRAPLVFDKCLALCNVGRVYISRDEKEKAKDMYEKAMELQSDVFSPKHILVQEMIANIKHTDDLLLKHSTISI